MRDSIVEVSTKQGEGNEAKKYKARGKVSVPISLAEAVQQYGEDTCLQIVIANKENEAKLALRSRLLAKLEGTSAPAQSEAELVNLDED